MVTPPAPRRALFGLSPSGLVSLTAVVLVLLVVSLPRLRGLALSENEVDARAVAERLAVSLGELGAEVRDVPLETLVRRAHLTRTLSDAEWLAQGEVLRLHGYLFALCPAPAPLQAAGLTLALTSGGEPPCTRLAVCAWPWSKGTGQRTFLATSSGALLAHENVSLRWHGLAQRPQLDESELWGWRREP